ncbi:putative regulator of G-protein signaling 9-binding protein-like [Apostichopus japonicus]|uniref:Putative regulator of G-protein signaling 9-binding protein-like n=1 Tax=Stichopus japonicus TaxID=307972 RepID=A0A2G8JRE0_STIJA|nr:putative regulator of G-protein signaling 9-binding protein-like [Apostichopus japonicus]
MKRARKKACNMVVLIKDTFIPVLKDTSNNYELKSKCADYERLWNTFSACVEVLEIHMRKTLDLQKAFPLYSGSCQLIQTGVMEPLGLDNIPVNVENLDVPNVDRMVLEREENNLLARDILQLRNMLSEMNRSVDIKPWTIEPLSEFSLNRSKSQSSLGDATSLIAFDPQYESRQRRKCTAWS